MTAPTRQVRGHTYLRDNHRCVAAADGQCMGGLEWNHRESSGHGGRGSKAPALTTADGVTACSGHNARFESDMQSLALAMGWKLKRNRRIAAADVPYFDTNDRTWYLPGIGSTRTAIIPALAQELVAAAGGLKVA